jgi:hypothetical protein
MSRPTTAERLEFLVHAALWVGWIVLIDYGTGNGIGYFQQPEQDLLAPLVNGALFNAATFVGHAFFLMPRYLRRRRWGAYLAGLAILFGGVIALKTLAEMGLIYVFYPSLRDLPFAALALENVYIFPAMILLSAAYRFGRDWIRRRELAETPQADRNESVYIKSGTRLHRVGLVDILYVEAADKYVAFILRGKKRLLSLMTMADVLGVLPRDDFERIHRSYIIAMNRIETVERNRLQLGGAILPIGQTYRRQFRARLADRAAASQQAPST